MTASVPAQRSARRAAGLSAGRARVYRLLARLFQPPDAPRLEALRSEDAPALAGVLADLGAGAEVLDAASTVLEAIAGAEAQTLQRAYDANFDVTAGLRCAPNETAHAPATPQETLTTNFQLADIAGFYRAFGVEVEPGTERVDHIAVELEFMHLLAVKQGMAEASGNEANAMLCRDAAFSFLRDHLACWSGKLGGRLQASGEGDVYRAAGDLLDRFVRYDAETLATDRDAPQNETRIQPRSGRSP